MKTRRFFTFLIAIMLIVVCATALTGCNLKKLFSSSSDKKPGTNNNSTNTNGSTNSTSSEPSYDFSAYDMTNVESLETFFDYIETNPNFTMDIEMDYEHNDLIHQSSAEGEGVYSLACNGVDTLTIEVMDKVTQDKAGLAIKLYSIDENHYGEDVFRYNYTSTGTTRIKTSEDNPDGNAYNTRPYFFNEKETPSLAKQLMIIIVWSIAFDDCHPDYVTPFDFTYDTTSESFKASLEDIDNNDVAVDGETEETYIHYYYYDAAFIEIKIEDNKCIIDYIIEDYSGHYADEEIIKEYTYDYNITATMYNIGNTVVTLPPIE